MVIGLRGVQFRENQSGQSITTVYMVTGTNITSLSIIRKSINRNKKDYCSDNDHDNKYGVESHTDNNYKNVLDIIKTIELNLACSPVGLIINRTLRPVRVRFPVKPEIFQVLFQPLARIMFTFKPLSAVQNMRLFIYSHSIFVIFIVIN